MASARRYRRADKAATPSRGVTVAFDAGGTSLRRRTRWGRCGPGAISAAARLRAHGLAAPAYLGDQEAAEQSGEPEPHG